MVQVLNELLDSFVIRAGREEPPIELAVGVPFAALAEFAAHKEQHLSREKPLVSQEGPEIGEATPVIAGHPREKRAFAVDDFVMGKGENEVFVMMIEHRESEIVLVV